MNEALSLRDSQVINLPVAIIAANPYQPRRFFDRASLEELSRSISEYGVIQPITVRLINGTSYELVAGERRLRASKLAGLTAIPAIVVDISDTDSAMLALIENLQRQDLCYFEEAEGYQSLIEDFAFTQEQLAKRVGKNQSTIANKLRLLRLPKEVQRRLIENSLTERHARALLKLDDEEEMLGVIAHVLKDGMNVVKTEEYIEKLLVKKHMAGRPKVKTYIKDIRIFTNSIKQAVDMMNKSGVSTELELEETGDGCLITIAVTY